MIKVIVSILNANLNNLESIQFHGHKCSNEHIPINLLIFAGDFATPVTTEATTTKATTTPIPTTVAPYEEPVHEAGGICARFSSALCEHYCHDAPDRPNRFRCTCRRGYELAANQRNCYESGADG